jgi:MFS family permease
MSRHIWERDFKLLWTGSAVSQLGAVGASTATPLLALSLGGSPISAGWATAAGALPGLLFHLPAGWLADRADRRRIMQVSQLVRMAAGVLFVGGLMALDGPPWLLLPAVVAAGTCAVFYGIAENAAVRDLVYSDDDTESPGPGAGQERGRQLALARHEARHHMAQVAGRPIGGSLFGVWPLLPYLLDAATALFSYRMVRKMEPVEKRRRAGPRPALVPVVAAPGLRKVETVVQTSRQLLARDRFLCTVLVVCAVANFFFQSVVLLLIVSAQERGVSSSLTGLFLSASGIGGLLGAFAAPRALRRAGPEKIVMWCVWSWLVLVLVVAVAGHPLVGLVAWGSCSFMGAHVNVALEVHKGAKVPPELQGKITGITRFLTGGAIPLGALSGGYIIAELAPHATAMLVTLVMAVMAVSVSIVAFPPKKERLAGMFTGGRRRKRSLSKKAPMWFAGRKSPVRPLSPGPPEGQATADLCHQTSLRVGSHDSMSQ